MFLTHSYGCWSGSLDCDKHVRDILQTCENLIKRTRTQVCWGQKKRKKIYIYIYIYIYTNI